MIEHQDEIHNHSSANDTDGKSSSSSAAAPIDSVTPDFLKGETETED